MARRAAATYSPEVLWTCTVVSPGEACATCAGTVCWGGYRSAVVCLSASELGGYICCRLGGIQLFAENGGNAGVRLSKPSDDELTRCELEP